MPSYYWPANIDICQKTNPQSPIYFNFHCYCLPCNYCYLQIYIDILLDMCDVLTFTLFLPSNEFLHKQFTTLTRANPTMFNSYCGKNTISCDWFLVGGLLVLYQFYTKPIVGIPPGFCRISGGENSVKRVAFKGRYPSLNRIQESIFALKNGMLYHVLEWSKNMSIIRKGHDVS